MDSLLIQWLLYSVLLRDKMGASDVLCIYPSPFDLTKIESIFLVPFCF